MKYRTRIIGGGGTTAGIEIPPSVLDALGGGKRPAVKATINGYTYRSSVATVSGAYMLGVSNEVRKAAGVAAGDEVDFEIVLDTEPRTVEVPEDFAAAMAAEPETRRVFDGLTFSFRRRYVDQLNDAKSEETRARRVAKFIDELRAGGPKR